MKLTYKAQDSKITNMKKIKAYAQKNNADCVEVKTSFSSSDVNVMYISYSGYKIIFALDNMLATKNRYGQDTEFTKDELHFIDNLGFDIAPSHQVTCGQEVSDWYE